MESLEKVEFFSDRLKLKILEPKYADRVLEFYIQNKKHLEPWEPERPEGFYTFAYQYVFLEELIESFKSGKSLNLWIFKKDDIACENIIGAVNFSNIILGPCQSCLLGYKIGFEYINNGYMTEAINKGVSIMFGGYKLHRIEANVIPRNSASNKVLKKIGFKEEGLSPEYLKINGVWEDHIRYSLINHGQK